MNNDAALLRPLEKLTNKSLYRDTLTMNSLFYFNLTNKSLYRDTLTMNSLFYFN